MEPQSCPNPFHVTALHEFVKLGSGDGISTVEQDARDDEGPRSAENLRFWGVTRWCHAYSRNRGLEMMFAVRNDIAPSGGIIRNSRPPRGDTKKLKHSYYNPRNSYRTASPGGTVMTAKSKPHTGPKLLLVGASLFFACSDRGAPSNPVIEEDATSRIARVATSLQPPLIVDGEEIEHWNVEDRMRQFNVPGVSVAVIDEGRLVWAKAWGVKEAGGDDPVTTDTLFQAGSVSKPVAALLALSLVGDGELALDRPVNEVLRSWKVPDNEFTLEQPVTLRHVLTHQAGFTPFGYLISRKESSVPGMAELLRGGINDWPAITVEFVPGSRYAYSNAGYCVLQLLLEETSESSLQDFAARKMFGPLGMDHSTFAEPLNETLLAAAASGHERKTQGNTTQREAVPVEGKAEIAPGATGGLWSTPSDLAAMAVEVMRTYRGESETLVTQDLARQFLTPQMSGRGLGISVDGEGTALRASHGGGMPGFVCLMVFYPETGQGAVVMTNSGGGRWLQQELIAAIAAEYGWPGYPVRRRLATATPDQLKELAGVYALDSAPEYTFSVRFENGKAIGQINQYPPFELAPTTDRDLYVLARESLEILFLRDENGAIVQVEMRRAGESGNRYSRLTAP